jgi:hypothetical protein
MVLRRCVFSLILALAAIPASAATLCFEAEHVNAMTRPWEIVEYPGASGGLAISLPEGGGTGGCFVGEPGTARYTLKVPEAGSWSVWLRVRWNGVCSNSVMLSVGRVRRRVSTKTLGAWHWRRAGAFPLKAGTVEIRLSNREDGVWVDQILLTMDRLKLATKPEPANIIPTGSSKPELEPAVFMTCAAGGLGVLPPTDFKLKHKGGATVRLSRDALLVVRSTRPSPLIAWVRNNRLVDTTTKLSITGVKGIGIQGDSLRTLRLKAQEPLGKVVFNVSPEPGLARRRHPAYLRIEHGTGRIVGRRVWLMRSWQWLVTQAMPCPKDTGLKTTSPLERATGNGFPGRVPGVTWRVADDDAVTPFGLLDLRKAVADRTYVMAYAYTAVECEKAGEYLLDVQHDDMIRVWLNGEPVMLATRCVPSVLSRTLTKVTLKKGRNDLLAKICQGKNYWEFGVRFRTLGQEPAPVRGLDVAPLLTKKEDTPG